MAPRRGRAAAAATAAKQPLDEEQPVVSTTDGDSGQAEAPKKPAPAVSRKGKKPQPATENGSNEPENAPVEPVNGNAAGSRKRKAKANDAPPADVAKPSRTRNKGKADQKNGVDAQWNVEETSAEPPATAKRTAKSKATKHQETPVEAEVEEQPAKPKRGRKDEIKNVPENPALSKAKGKTPASEEQPTRGKKAKVADDAEHSAEEAAPSKAPAKKTAPKKRKGATETTVEPASAEPAQDKPAGNGRSATSRRKPVEKAAPANEPEMATPKSNAPLTKAKQPAKAKEPAKAAAKAKKGKKDEKQETQPENNDVDEIDGGILAKKPSKPKKKAKKTAASSDEEEHVPLPKKRKPVDEQPAPETVDEPKAGASEHTPSTITKRKKPAAKPAEKSDQQKMNAVLSDFGQIDFDADKEHTLKICSWNVAGLRAMVNKSGHEYFEHEKPDIICLQEIKCLEDQVPEQARLKDYHPYWCSTPGGRGGVALLTRKMPYNVEVNLGDAEMDEEGRVITADYTKFFLVCVYVPNAGRNLANLERRLRWNKLFEAHVNKLKQTKPVIICGDLNVAHNEIDLANPKTNTKNAGFSKEERAGMDDLLGYGFVDTFRHLYPDREKAYTFWTYMGGARAKNVGWRLDYSVVSENLMGKVVDSFMRPQVLGSDHCPIVLLLNI